MDRFFDPKSVVVVGASNARFNLGATICELLKSYISFPGNVYAVNSKGESVHGFPGFSSILDLPEPTDLAVIIVPAAAVAGIVRDCATRGIKRVVIESSGFSEEGEAGAAMQCEIDEVARANGIRVMGPNCLGILSTHSQFCCFYGFDPSLKEMREVVKEPGSVSYLIQSGGIGVVVLESAFYDLVGVNKIASIGNKCDVDDADLIEYFQHDQTKVICIYLENIKDGRRLMEAARRSRKPILVFKVGRTEDGARAAASHTSGMANNDRVFDAACRQAGIIRLNSADELHSLPKIFTEMPPLAGRRIAAFTNSGAFGGIGSDLLVEAGLSLAQLSPRTQEKLKKTGQIFNVKNPVDIGPALPQTYLDIFDILLSADEVDGLLTMLSVWRPFVIDCLHELVKMCRHYNKPAGIYTPNAVARTIAIRTEHRLPIFESVEQAVRALAVSHQYYESMQKRGFAITTGSTEVAS